MISSIIIKIQSSMSEQEKKWQRIYDLLNAGTKPKINFQNNWSFFLALSSRDLKPLDYAIWGILENKTNATSHPKIGSLKTAIEEEWNKMLEELILKAYKSFLRCIDTTEKKKKKWQPYWLNLFCIYLLILLFSN